MTLALISGLLTLVAIGLMTVGAGFILMAFGDGAQGRRSGPPRVIRA